MVENLFKRLIPTGVNTKVYILNLQRFLSAPEVSTKVYSWPETRSCNCSSIKLNLWCNSTAAFLYQESCSLRSLQIELHATGIYFSLLKSFHLTSVLWLMYLIPTMRLFCVVYLFKYIFRWFLFKLRMMFTMTSAKLTPEICCVYRRGTVAGGSGSFRQSLLEDPFCHEVQKGPPCFLKSFSELLGAAGSNLSLRLLMV